MATLIGANFFIYFSATDDVDRVKCKLCNKRLKNKRNFNLKQHLKHSHRIEVRLDKNKIQHGKINIKNSRKLIANPHEVSSTSTRIYEYSENNNAKNMDTYYDVNTQALDSNDLFGRSSTAAESPRSNIVIKPERLQEAQIGKPSISTEEAEDNCDFEDNIEDNNTEIFKHNPSRESFQSDDTFEDFSIKVRENKRNYASDPLNESSNLLTSRDNLEPRSQTKKRKFIRDVLVDELASSSHDQFEQWAKKKKQLIEIEYLEMRNYKIKLELYEREQELRLAASKFTKDIRSNC